MHRGSVAMSPQGFLQNIFLENMRERGMEGGPDDGAPFTLQPPLRQGKEEEVKKADGGG